MIGGDPTRGETYGYVHYKGNKGVIALRNPQMKEQHIEVKLDPAYGMDPEARSLVLERVYPDHWIAPDLYAAGASIRIPLEGYESAIYEVYPLDSAARPLLAGVSFRVKSHEGNKDQIEVLKRGRKAKFLNPEEVASVTINGKKAMPLDLQIPPAQATPFEQPDLHFAGSALTAKVRFGSDIRLPRFVVFLHPDSASMGQPFPDGKLSVDGKAVAATLQRQKGVWSVYSYMLKNNVSGTHTYKFTLGSKNGNSDWKGRADVWLLDQQAVTPVMLSITARSSRKAEPMPPSPYEKDAAANQFRLGSGMLSGTDK